MTVLECISLEDEDAEYEFALIPQNADGIELMTHWIAAREDIFVEVEEVR